MSFRIGKVRDKWPTSDDTPLPGPDALHMVRESAQYALGLLMRNQAGDKERANRIINLVLDSQFDEPGQPYHGTFYRYPEEAHPPARSLMWRDYDPNWREFIGSCLAIILDEFSSELEPGLEERVYNSIKLIIAGTLSRPLPASYTNIVLMKAFMLVYAGNLLNNPEWTGLGEALAEEIYAHFSETGCFDEYNSPTYYGVDLMALGMWVTFSTSPRLRELGEKMEALLWLEIARFYHAGLKNIGGPFDRSYGMDMRKYVTGVGISMRLGLGKELAALPDTAVAPEDFQAAHKDDLPILTMWAAAVGVRIPEEARAIFTSFSGERSVERLIQKSPQRVATAWLSENVMLGAEDASRTKPVWNQYHLATMHWRSSNNDVAWLKLMNFWPADARVEKNNLKIKSFLMPGLAGEPVYIFRVYTPDAPQGVRVEAIHWQFPGLNVQFETNAEGPVVTQNGPFTDIQFEANHKEAGFQVFFNLTVEAQPLS